MNEAQIRKIVQSIVDKNLADYFQKTSAFRARKLGDTSTDARQLATNAGVTAVVQQTVAGYFPLTGGDLNDGANIGTGTSVGTQFGTSAAEKIGFHGKAATVQQNNTAGNVSAGATYTSNEQAMLNDAYSALRNLGLLS